MTGTTAEPPQAILYLRSASGHQADRDMAIVAQQHVCAWRAHELQAPVVGEYVDFGSGLTTERPGVSDLIRRLRELRQATRHCIYVIAADHARIGQSVQAYSHVSYAIEQAGGWLIIASVPQIQYDALTRRATRKASPLMHPDDDNQ